MATDWIAEEVSRLVRDAAAVGRIINPWREAERLLYIHSDTRTVRQIAEMIVRASASVAGITMELGPEEPETPAEHPPDLKSE
jgi:hypothetical protein